MKLCITGGGTGGHLSIAKALAQAAQKKGIETIFIGSTSGQDQSYFADCDLFKKRYFLKTTGVVDKKGGKKFTALFEILKALLHSRRILKHHKIDALISVGGFSAAPASLAAVSMRIPFFIHEQNAKTGRLNALLRPFAKAFFSSYDPASPIRSYPVRDIFFDTARTRKEIKTIIFLGGSQGAVAINDLALKSASTLAQRGIRIIHQSGKYDYERVRAFYDDSGIKAELFDFSDNLPSYMAQADLAVSRSGASTLWELCANGLPALFIPYPYAAGDHQYFNAKYLLDHDLAWLVRQDANPKKKLLEILDYDLETKSERVRRLVKKGGAQEILDFIQKVLS